MLTWNCRIISLPLKHTWAIARGQSTEKQNLLIEVTDGTFSGRGEAAPNSRYGESPEQLQQQFDHANQSGDVLHALDKHPITNALRFAITSAYRHYCCQRDGVTLWKALNSPVVHRVNTAYAIPIMEPEAIEAFIKDNALTRFHQLKVKTDPERAEALLKAVSRHYTGTLLVDGNEGWTDPDEVLRLMEKTRDLPVALFEQPLPASETEAYHYLKKRATRAVFADESVTDTLDVAEISRQFHGINVKLMKAGSYENGIRLLQQARAAGLQTMVGCMVETSLGIAAALHLTSLADYVDLDSFLYLKEEPFGLVREQQGVLSLTD